MLPAPAPAPALVLVRVLALALALELIFFIIRPMQLAQVGAGECYQHPRFLRHCLVHGCGSAPGVAQQQEQEHHDRPHSQQLGRDADPELVLKRRASQVPRRQASCRRRCSTGSGSMLRQQLLRRRSRRDMRWQAVRRAFFLRSPLRSFLLSSLLFSLLTSACRRTTGSTG